MIKSVKGFKFIAEHVLFISINCVCRIPESRKISRVEYRIREKYCLWYLESWALESGIKLKKSGIPLEIGI